MATTEHLEQPHDEREDVARGQAGRTRLSPERTAELYRCVRDLLVESGYEALTMDAVAQRAHTSKATIYRQWGGKPGLVAAAVHALKDNDAELDTGTLRGDFVALAEAIGSVAATDGPLFAAVSHAVITDAALAAAMREAMFEPAQAKVRAVLDRALQRGEIEAGNPAIEMLPGLLLQAVVGRQLLDGCPVDAVYLVGLVDSLVLPALGLPSAPSARSHNRQIADDAASAPQQKKGS
ncbi:MAG TPA: TetR/AcrR family transcriptional regulator [Acidimicrobiales bacterium]|nr:TetR/AcrR family transcriptional regulator [Acidimicrobiales bacterium]